MADQSINIKFPLQDSVKGFFLDTNKTSTDAIKSDILHVLLTAKGERFYLPKFGCNLRQYLFDPNDDITLSDVKSEANASLLFAMPNIQITSLETTLNEQTITLSIVAVDSTDVFQEQIFIQVDI